MIKYFCDLCGTEINDTTKPGSKFQKEAGQHTGELIFKEKKIRFSVSMGLNDAWNSGDFCKKCILDVVKQS